MSNTPTRMDLTILPADPPTEKKIGWTCYELTNIYIPEGGRPQLRKRTCSPRKPTSRWGPRLLLHDLWG